MTMALRPWLLAACMAVGIGCSATSTTQVVTGKISTSGAIAVRAVTDDSVVTAGRVHSDGSFSLALPAGHRYRLELLTTSGVRPILARSGGALSDLQFRVCEPIQPFDCGQIGGNPGPGTGPCDPMTDPSCMCDPSGNCSGGGSGSGGPIMGCDPTTDPLCVCDANGQCVDGNCDPATDPMCGPICEVLPDGTTNCGPQCDPTTDPTCPCTADPNGGLMCPPPPPPPPCDPTTDPMCPCMVDANGTTNCPPPPACDPSTNDCECNPQPDGQMQCWPPPCDPTVDVSCPQPPPPCMDPMDPNSCQDPCMTDPGQCGCATTMNVSSQPPDCWPPPQPPMCDSAGHCDPNGVAPQHAPGDFGCGG